jgi:hypothetical protein
MRCARFCTRLRPLGGTGADRTALGAVDGEPRRSAPARQVIRMAGWRQPRRRTGGRPR